VSGNGIGIYGIAIRGNCIDATKTAAELDWTGTKKVDDVVQRWLMKIG